jgi:hypothetical protein
MALRTTSRPILREALLAALVLALVFLNFGHTTAFARTGYDVDSSWCGDPLSPDPVAHAPCHACRVGEGAALPPVPVASIPLVPVTTQVDYRRAIEPVVPASLYSFVQARGPPLA